MTIIVIASILEMIHISFDKGANTKFVISWLEFTTVDPADDLGNASSSRRTASGSSVAMFKSLVLSLSWAPSDFPMPTPRAKTARYSTEFRPPKSTNVPRHLHDLFISSSYMHLIVSLQQSHRWHYSNLSHTFSCIRWTIPTIYLLMSYFPGHLC
jgi:hypothetical protein